MGEGIEREYKGEKLSRDQREVGRGGNSGKGGGFGRVGFPIRKPRGPTVGILGGGWRTMELFSAWGDDIERSIVVICNLNIVADSGVLVNGSSLQKRLQRSEKAERSRQRVSR